MDKYEYNLKLDQMKALIAEGNYAAAAEIVDSINWRKVKNVNLLVKAGDVYIRQKRYEEARDILFMAYDRSPIGRMIIYRLAEISIKMKNLDDAEEYYREFVEIAPHDNLKYVLRYKISRAENADIQTLIAILEELKEAEYTEEWAYHLAYLYHKAGESEKCIDACDELILWFGEGIYVERALELKMLYQPLSKAQEDKYRTFRQRRDGLKEIHPNEENVVRIPVVQENVERFNTANLQEELAKSMQQIMDATEKETVDDTMDNIKKMVEEIPYLQMMHHEEESKAEETSHIETDAEIDDTLRDNFKEMLSEDNGGQAGFQTTELAASGQMSIEAVLSEWEKTRRAAQTALQMAQRQKLESAKARALQEAGDIMDRLADVIPKLDAGITPSQLMKDEYLQGDVISNEERAGRYVADMNDMLQQQINKLQEEVRPEEQIEQEEVRPEEQIEQEEPAVKEHELMRRIKRAKPNFDRQIGLRPYVPRQFVMKNEMENLSETNFRTDTLPRTGIELAARKLSEPGSGTEVFSEVGFEQETESLPGTVAEILSEIEIETGAGILPETESGAGNLPEAEIKTAAGNLPETGLGTGDPAGIEIELAVGDLAELGASTLAELESEPAAGNLPETEIESESLTETEEALESEFLEEDLSEEMKLAEAEFYGVSVEELPEAAEEKLQKSLFQQDSITKKTPEEKSALLQQDTKEIWTKKIAAVIEEREKELAEQEKDPVEETKERPPKITKLSEEQKAIFSYFVPVAGMEKQICTVLDHTVEKLTGENSSSQGNILIQGGVGCGKTVLAKALVKALQKETKKLNNKAGKIDAKVLNKKDLDKLLKKVDGGCLIIERAGELNRETALKLSLLLDNTESKVLIIMEDTRAGLEQVLGSDESLARKFTEKIKIPVFTSDELVEFGQAYAHDLDYEIDNMGVLALYNRISNIQRLDQATTLTEVKEIVDEAIANAEKKSLKKAFSILTSRRYTEDDYIILREKDFEE